MEISAPAALLYCLVKGLALITTLIGAFLFASGRWLQLRHKDGPAVKTRRKRGLFCLVLGLCYCFLPDAVLAGAYISAAALALAAMAAIYLLVRSTVKAE